MTRYPWATFVILGIWTAVTVIVINRDMPNPEQMYLFASTATLIISFMGFV